MAEDVTVGTAVVEVETKLVVPPFKDQLKVFLYSILSRKFIAAVTMAYALYVEKRYWEAATVIASFLGIEGAGDIVERKERARPQTPIVQEAENVTVESQGTTKRVSTRRRG